MRTWMLPAISAVLAIALVVSTAIAVDRTRQAGDAQERADRLDTRVRELRDELAVLHDELEAARAADGSPEEPDGSEVDGEDTEPDDGSPDLDGLLDGLFGASIPGQDCFVPDGSGGLDGMFDGLFGGSSLPDDTDELVQVVSDHVAEMRDLEWQEPVDVDFLDTSSLQARLEAIIDEDLDRDEVDASERLLVTLGAIPAGESLEQLQRDLLDDQVAGFYSSDTGELVVRVPDDGGLRPADKVTLAHELEHALADQVLGIPDRREPQFADDADASLGVLAVVEGDATLLMNLWALEYLPITDQLAMAMDPNVAAAQAALDGIPHFLQRELLYPYTDGLEWACQTFLAGGWPAVDAAYEDPPATSAEVLWGEPVAPAGTPDLNAPDGFDELTTTTMGAAHVLWLFEAPGGDTDRALDEPDARAQAWGGGTVTVWGRDADTAVGLSLADGGRGSTKLCDSVEDWYLAAFPDATASVAGDVTTFEGGDAEAALRCEGDDVVLGIAPDLATATSIVG